MIHGEVMILNALTNVNKYNLIEECHQSSSRHQSRDLTSWWKKNSVFSCFWVKLVYANLFLIIGLILYRDATMIGRVSGFVMTRWQDWADVTVTEVKTVFLCDLQSAAIGLLYHNLHIVQDEVKGHAPHWLWGLLHKPEKQLGALMIFQKLI